MKKLFILIFSIFLLSSCFGIESQELKDAKKELLYSSGSDNITNNLEKTNSQSNLEEQETISSPKKSYYEIKYLTQNTDLKIDDIKNIEEISDSLDITGYVENDLIDKIEVVFFNRDSSFPKDDYVLKEFKKGDKTFLYRAYKKYQVLDNYYNEYDINAYSGDEIISEINLVVYIKGNDTKISNDSKKEIVSIGEENNILSLNLPVNDTYGEVVKLGENSFTYSKINDLEIFQENFDNLTCENLGDYLSENYSWYYWNSCIPYAGNNGFYFNLLYLDGENYFYERHYIDLYHSIHGIINLEKGTGISKDSLSEENTKLKGKTFDITTITDSLFKEITK